MSLLVVKCGGAVARASAAAIASLARGGDDVCVVHGAGPQISAEMDRRGLPVEFVARPPRDRRRLRSTVVRESLAARQRGALRGARPAAPSA